MTDSSFAAMAITTCSTERATLTGGFSAYLPYLKCTPIAPVDAETRQRLQINTPVTIWEVHIQDNPDIRAGDKLVIDGVKYPVKTKEPYVWLPTGDKRVRLILEELRNAI